MLPSKYRLTLPEFLYHQKTPLPRHDSHDFSYRFKKTSPGSPPKIVFWVPKRLSKLATQRNKTKRVLSEAFFPFLPRIKNGYWLSIQPKKILTATKPTDLYSVIARDLKKIDLLLS